MKVRVNTLEIELTLDEYCRLVYTTIPCAEAKCNAHRGEACHRLIKRKGFNGMRYPHYWRRMYFTKWKKANPGKFIKLVNQILEQRRAAWENPQLR